MRNFILLSRIVLPIFFLIFASTFSGVIKIYAEDPPPFERETAKKVDQLYLAAQSAETRSEAIEGLKAFIEDKESSYDIKKYAIEKLGSLNIEEMEEYFFNIALRGPSSKTPWNEAFLAYWKIKFNHEPNPQKQVALLKEALKAELNKRQSSLVRAWASEELCNRGVESAFSAIVESIKSQFSNPRDIERETSLCRMKLDALSSSPTRFQAFENALKGGDPTDSSAPLKHWAVRELGLVKTEEANRVLADYALYLQKAGTRLSEQGNPDLRNYFSLHSHITDVLVNNGWSNQKLSMYGIKDTNIFRRSN